MSDLKANLCISFFILGLPFLSACGPKYHYSLESTVTDLGLGVLPEAILRNPDDPLKASLITYDERPEWENEVWTPYWDGKYLCETANSVGWIVDYLYRPGDEPPCVTTEVESRYELPSGQPFLRKDGPPIYITDEFVQHYSAWRNRFGRPLTMFSMGPDHSLEAKVKYSVRLAIGHLFGANALNEAFRNEFPDVDTTEITGWLVRNLSEYSARGASTTLMGLYIGEYASGSAFPWTIGENAVAELFAWYTAPWYQKGSLPGRIESALENMAQFKVGAWWDNASKRYRGRRRLWEKDLVDEPFLNDLKAALAQARSAEPCDCYPEHPLLSDDDKMFVYLYRWEKQFRMPWVTYDLYAVAPDEYPDFYDNN